MPKIGYVLLAEEVLTSEDKNKTVLVEPVVNIDVEDFPSTKSLVGSVGLFNLAPSVEYACSAIVYSPTGDKIKSNFFDFKTSNEKSIHLTLTLKYTDLVFEEEGVYLFTFHIANLHEQKSTFFYVKKKERSKDDEQFGI